MFKKLICFFIPVVIFLLPHSLIPINNYTESEHRVFSIFIFAILAWVLEPIPIFATSILIIFLELILVSDKGLSFLKLGFDDGVVLSYKEIFATFSSPIILLFLGGFFLSIAAIKVRLDINLARVLLKPFGSEPRRILLGLMLITALFSMFMSNTATAAMMLAILSPILKLMDENDMGKVAFALAIPFAANIGGIGTPIGTPPNAVVQKYLTGEFEISFGEWMLFGVPFVLLLIPICWLVILKFYPIKTESIQINLRGKFLKTKQANIVYFTYLLTIFLWLLGGKVHGMSSHVVAMFPVAIFCATKVITTEDLKKINWDVLWLVSGGIALGMGLEKTNLSRNLIETIPFSSMSPFLLISIASVVALLMSTFMSNTATANLLLPIMAVMATQIPSLKEFGDVTYVLIPITFACSLAMAMPISTPPNALGFATGLIETQDLVKVGVFMGLIGLFVTLAITFYVAYLLQ